MLPPEYLAVAADPVVEIYNQVEQDIANDIARRIVKTGKITDTAQWQLARAREMGYFQKDVIKTLANASGKSEREIKRLIKEAGIEALAKDDAIYAAAGLSPVPIAESPVLKALLLQGTDKTIQLINNFTKTTATTATTAYMRILDRAYLQILSGAFDPTTTIKQAINDVAKNGIEKIAYPSGAQHSVEASVRRAVLTGLNQTTAKLQLARAEEMGCDLVEVTSHAGARPSHAEWQGRVYCIKGKHKNYEDFYRATGYGTGDGLCGWNCYHSFYPFFEGLSTRSFVENPSQEYLGKRNEEMYRQQQKQRYYERQVRAAKKECLVLNAAIEVTDDEQLKNELYADFQRTSVKLKNREARLSKFVKEVNRTRLNEREMVAGWNRSVSSKAVWANKKDKRRQQQ